jgi:putative zinc finger protein
MTCTDVRARLPLLLSGDLAAAEVDEIRQHLTRCPSCQEERTAIVQVRHLLDAVPAPAVTVDLPRLYRDAAEGQVRRLRRWRGATVAVLAAAAAVVVALLLFRMEIRMDAHQLVLRWGAVPAQPDPPPAPVPPREERPIAPAPVVSTAEVDQQLGLLRELVEAVSNDADLRDERRQQEIAQLRGRMQGLEQQMTQLRLATERDLSALYATQLPEKERGPQR